MVRCVLRAAQALHCHDAAGLGDDYTIPWRVNPHGPQPHSSSSNSSASTQVPLSSEGQASAAATSSCKTWGSQRTSIPAAQFPPSSACPTAASTGSEATLPCAAAPLGYRPGGWWSHWFAAVSGAHSHPASQAWAAQGSSSTATTTAANTHSTRTGSSTLCAGGAAPTARCAAAATPAEWSFSSASSRPRPLLLASLTTSSLAASATPAGPGLPASPTASTPANTQSPPGGSSGAAAGGAGQMAGGGPSRVAAATGGGEGGAPLGRAPGASIGPLSGFTLPQVSIASPPGPVSYQADQDLAQELMAYHTAKHGGFPRPCLICGSSEFLTPAAPSQQGGQQGQSAQQQPSRQQQQQEQEGEVVAWASRPLRCDGCQGWLHFGCAGVRRAELVPPAPWFHCNSCRNQYLRLEAFAARNPHPSFNGSPAHSLYVLTPVDDVRQRAGRGARGPMSAVRVLLQQGFEGDAVAGFGDPSREYDGGRYAAVLVHQGTPVSTATFNVFGPIAQLNMIATAVPHRRKGHASVLLSDVESVLAGCGVERVLVQPRGSDLGLWGGRWGYRALLPEEAVERHKEVPVAYYDCGILEKELGQLVFKRAGVTVGAGEGQRAAQRLVSR